METKRNGALLGLPDHFVTVEIETEATPAFDAAQYSFFGDLSAADSGLEGALEDGLEAPPPEEGLSSQDYGFHGPEEEVLPLEEEEDLSVASMFRTQLGLGAAKSPPKRSDQDEDAALDALLTDPLSVARKQLRDDDYDARGLPSDLYSQDLSETQAAAPDQPQSVLGTTTTYGLFDGYTSAQASNAQPPGSAGPAGQSPPLRQPTPTAPPSIAGSALLQMLKEPSQSQPKAMTLEELEALILGNAQASVASQSSQPGRVESAAGVAATLPAAGPPGPGMAGGRLLPGQPVGLQGPPPHLQPAPGAAPLLPGGVHPTAFYPQVQPPPPPPPHLHGPGYPQVLPLSLSGQPLLPPSQANGPGYSQMLGAHGPMGPAPPHMMYGANGMVPPPPPHHVPTPNPHPALVPPGAMVQLYGPPGGLLPGGSVQYGPPGPDGLAQFPHGLPAPVSHMAHGMGPRPGGNLGLHAPVAAHGPGQGGMRPGPAGTQRPGGLHVSPQRPGGLHVSTSPSPPPQQQQQPHARQQGGGALQRHLGVLGQGAAAGQRPGPQARGPGGSGFGQQFGPRSTIPGQSGALVAVPVALAAAAAGRAGGAGSGPGGRLGGKWMPPEDIEYVVRSLSYGAANGVAYVEDYYYQAFVHKHMMHPSQQQLSPGAFPVAALFVPEALRNLTADQMRVMRLDPSAHVKFVEGIQGLGKIVLSNIRTPKVLMDLTDRGSEEASGKPKAAGSAGATAAADEAHDNPVASANRAARPLEQEPLLAARIMIEDCMNLLLDVDDIDRLAAHMAAMVQAQQRAAAVAAALPLPAPAAAAVAAAGAAAAAASTAAGTPSVGPYGPAAAVPPSRAELRQRRELLLAGINGAFRLPNAPRGATAAELAAAADVLDEDAEGAEGVSGGAGCGIAALGDGVLLRIMALSKGRSLVARALQAVAPPASLAVAASKAGKADREQEQAEKTGKAAAAGAVAAAGEAVEGCPGASAGGGEAVAPSAPGAAEAGAAVAASPESASPYVLLWGVLRNAWMLFGSSLQHGLDAASERPMVESTARLAAALRDALLRLPTARDVLAAAVAFNSGCRQHTEALLGPGGANGASQAAAGSMEVTLLPLAQMRAVEAAPAGPVAAAPSAWLGEALAALVTRASHVGLVASAAEIGSAGAIVAADGEESGEEGKATAALNAEWGREFGQLHGRVSRHLTALGGIHSMAVAGGNAEALAVVRALCCRLLVNAMLPHASEAQAQQLREALQAFAA